MGLPEIRRDTIIAQMQSADIVRETAEQIKKDFGMFGVEIISGDTSQAYPELPINLAFKSIPYWKGITTACTPSTRWIFPVRSLKKANWNIPNTIIPKSWLIK